MKQIELKQVSKRFGDVEVIPPIDLEIEEGEFVVFVGPSGCGKSTLLRLIAGLEDVTLGQILIDGQDATLTPPSKRSLAMVFQSYALILICRFAKTLPSHCAWQVWTRPNKQDGLTKRQRF